MALHNNWREYPDLAPRGHQVPSKTERLISTAQHHAERIDDDATRTVVFQIGRRDVWICKITAELASETDAAE